MTNEKNLTGAFDLFSKSWEIIQKNFLVFFILFLIPLGNSAHVTLSKSEDKTSVETYLSAATNTFSKWSPTDVAAVVGGSIIVAVALIALSFILQTMTTVAQLDGARGKKLALPDLWKKSLPLLPRFVGLSLIIGVLFIGGLILFIVPGFIVLRRYFLAPYYLIDKNLSISEAMNNSSKDSKEFSNHIWPVIGVTILISLIGVAPIIGSIASIALAFAYSVAPAIRYLEIQKAK